MYNSVPYGRDSSRILPITLALLGFSLTSPGAQAVGEPIASRSTNIAINADGSRLINLNHDSDSVSIFRVNPSGAGQNALTKLAEVKVGDEPHCVAIHPTKAEAYVTTADGFVSVISLSGVNANKVVKTIAVKSEPRGCALTPTGNLLYVANHTHGSVSVINTTSRLVVATTGQTFGRPWAVTISNNGDGVDTDERVFVTDFFAEVIPTLAGGPGRPFDTGNRGRVFSFPVGDFKLQTTSILSPLANAGFTADRTAFCAPTAHSQVYCPNPLPPDLANVPQGAFPNQLYAGLIRNGQLFVPSIGAAPEPPVRFNVNVQALVHAVNTSTLQEITANHVNLNAQIKDEVQPANPTASLGKLFGNDIVAVDANSEGTDYFFVSRGGNYVLKAKLVDGKLNIGAPDGVSRFLTGNIPTGIVVSPDGKRAYTNNEVGRSVSVLNLSLTGDTVATTEIPSAGLPQIGSLEHNQLMGKLVFYTALGTPDDGLSKTGIRDINPLAFRGKQSDNAWSSCASCHPAGLADGVTWVFADGPRQTIPLDSTYSKLAMGHDTRILNWSAVRGSNTDFNNNSRGVQGGTGFVSNPLLVRNHGPTHGVSEALDLETLWIGTIRTLNQSGGSEAGRQVFETNCASCHGGAKWTKSQVLYRDNPALVGVAPSDTGVQLAADGGGQIKSLTANGNTLDFLESVGTYNAANPLEIKAIGTRAFGESGFNVPSLLGVKYNAPYFHDGSAATLTDVYKTHRLGGGTINSTLSNADRSSLTAFLNALDGKATPMSSEADKFRGLP